MKRPQQRVVCAALGVMPVNEVKLFQCGFVEFFPVVEIIEVDGVARSGSVVGNAVGGEDALASGVVMIVAGDRGVEFVDGRFVEFHTRLLFDPRFELRIGGPVVFDVVDHSVAVEAERVDDHLVVAFAGAGITSGEFSAGLEGNLEPEAGQMEHTERAGDAGTD